jgi:hypothetical protein
LLRFLHWFHRLLRMLTVVVDQVVAVPALVATVR